jgi:hypothetical protein
MMFIYRGKNGRPLPPFDPNEKEVVRTSGGWYYLRTKKPKGENAILNPTFRKNKNSLQTCSPAAVSIRRKLDPWLQHLTYGHTHRIILGALMKSYKANGGKKVDYDAFLHLDLFEKYTLERLVGVPYKLNLKKNSVEIIIPIKENTVRRQNKVVNNYFFELILISGDPLKERSLRVEDVGSELYPYDKAAKEPCVLEMVLPTKKAPWMCILRVNSTEYKLRAAHMKNYAMYVVAVGGGEMQNAK